MPRESLHASMAAAIPRDADAGFAATAARRMFEEASGPLNVLGFELGDVHQEGEVWVVECSFWPGMGTREKTRYRVMVARDGSVLQTQKLGSK